MQPMLCPISWTPVFQFEGTRLYLVAMGVDEDEDWSAEDIDAEFPLGDGTADREAIVH